jgi:hypothetical protein
MALRKCALDLPLLGDFSARRKNSSQRVLQSFLIAGLFADANVSHQTEHRSAPVGAPPGRRVIEPFVARFRFTLRHVAGDVVPHTLGRKLSCLYPGNRLDVNRYAFLDPVVPSVHGREGQVDHFVREHPVFVQLRNRSICA